MPLTASSQALGPHDADVVPKSRQQARVCRYREVGEVPSKHGAEILPLLVNRHMPAPSKRLLDLAELGTHSLSLRLAPELETGTTLLGAAIVCQPEEVERFRLTQTTLRSTLGSVSAELNEAGLFRMQTKRERREAFSEIVQETLRITPMLEPDDLIIGIAHDDHVAFGVTHAPLRDPEIVDIMEVHVRKKRRYHRTLRGALRGLNQLVVFQYTRPQPFLDQADESSIAHPVLDEPYEPISAQSVEEPGYVGV